MPRPFAPAFGLLLLVAAPSFADDWWSLRPLARPPVPAGAAHPIDAFVRAKLREKGLTPAPEADRRTLLRRLSIDLTGLPPTPVEIAAFMADKSPGAYAKQVDRLLGSPRYGERWARHWLDVAHYADSHGHDQDRFRPNAWPYRDYLIRSFNADTPYARFVKEQIAGDVLDPADPAAVIATGFLAAGPWDESGLRDIREDSLDRIAARNLDRDDIVTSVFSTFAGMTVGCARCHDHKFDPVTQVDYYALQAVFAGIDKAERAYDVDPAVAKRRAALVAEQARVAKLTADELLTAGRQAEAAAFEKTWRIAEVDWFTPEPAARSKQGSVLTVLPDRSVRSGGPRPERDTYTVTLTADRQSLTGLRLEVLPDDLLPHRGPGRQDNGNLHLSEIRVTAHPAGEPGKSVPVKLAAAVADFYQAGWAISRAIDGDPATAWGIYPEVGKPHRAVFAFEKPVGFPGGTVFTVELDQLHGGGHLIGRFRLALTTTPHPANAAKPPPAALASLLAVPAEKRTPAQRAELARLAYADRLTRDLAALPAQAKVYCGTNRFAADGSFRPTTAPRPIHMLKRGEVTKPEELIPPGAVAVVRVLFNPTNPADEGARRAALAEWLASPDNPLTWRVIVNRIWHYHFGRGIADTPNDLGRMGGPPSHPELLDWLAAEFRDGGGSLKKLHRLIVTSETYKQSVRHDPAAAAVDADNRLLWRMNRTRLDAETVRDAVLLAAGRLDLTMYGPPVMHFQTKPGKHVTPEADYDRFDVDSLGSRRRGVYRFIFRTRPDPLLAALDCPDGSQSAPARSASVGPLPALALWNNKFILKNSEYLAARVAKESPDVPGQVAAMSRWTLGREPTSEEAAAWADHARRFGGASLARVLFNSSEFVFVE